MALSKLTLGILYPYLKLRKQRLDLQRATESQATVSAMTGLASAATSPSTSPKSDFSDASATSEEDSPPSPADSSTSELSLLGTSTTDSTLTGIPTIDLSPPHDSHRSTSRRGPGGR